MTENVSEAEAIRIHNEYARRGRELPASRYTLRQPSAIFLREGTGRLCLEALEREGMLPLWDRKVADLGCGSGTWLLQLLLWGADPRNLFGIDLEEERIRRARYKIPACDLRVGDIRNLPWPDASFDLLTQFTVFTSILSETVKKSAAAEMLRVLKPGGLVLWYDFRVDNPRNPNVRGIGAREIRSLFADCSVKLRSGTLAPPVARRTVPISWILSLCLERIPFLRTHYVGTIRKPGGARR